MNSWVVVGCCRGGEEGGVCSGIVGGRVHFLWYAFFTNKKCMST